mmetsp:Transcript_5907/g.12342  ORF Transcript_5907/g.12342 Transcript_5907/m.12342 type:complete len:346 (+) Transcript_5907:28-1065(+)
MPPAGIGAPDQAPQPSVYSCAQISRVLDAQGFAPRVLVLLQDAYRAYTRGDVVLGPVTHYGGPSAALRGGGDFCLKTGFLANDDVVVVKVAPGSFTGNIKLSPPLPSNTGVMMLFSQDTGRLESILLDEGILTEVRTALAGALAAQLFAPSNLQEIGILGCGIQARYQLEALEAVTNCRKVVVWGRDGMKARQYQQDMQKAGVWQIEVVSTPQEVAQRCRLLVTVTSAAEPLLRAGDVLPGTHITCIGADADGKQELDPAIFCTAAVVVCDSRSQCCSFGEVSAAVKSGLIDSTAVLEMGQVIDMPELHRKHDDTRITIFDSTGIAAQDVTIAKAVYQQLRQAAL